MTSNPIFLLLFGVFVGFFSGLMGLGGGAVIIPILVLVFGFEQAKAHGTSLAMILSPTQIPALITYHSKQFIDWWLVLWVVPGMLAGSWFGAKLATSIPKEALQLVFGFVLIYIASYTVFSTFGREHLTRTLSLSVAVTLVAVGIFLAVRFIDQRGAKPDTRAMANPPSQAASEDR